MGYIIADYVVAGPDRQIREGGVGGGGGWRSGGKPDPQIGGNPVTTL